MRDHVVTRDPDNQQPQEGTTTMTAKPTQDRPCISEARDA
ncbi:hypothetical protein SEA_JAKEO_63 [Mycobacterium phage JakeO]|uniref:Uncharacterized protein n=2 Tax=Pegunavirus oline TaxID=1986350 RepID=A0A3S9UJC0_9CAUD|nr:hypothetical protein SEA_JAKEO_63 [Mycobacterium phage JakeO]AZS10338.1 hypothetical protein SEA_STRUGGLE_63 [Mycobacterium phage Struggle]